MRKGVAATFYESNREKYTFKPFTECFFHFHSLLYITNFLQADVACRSLGHRGASAAFLGGLYGERASPVQRVVVPLTISKEKSSSNILFFNQDVLGHSPFRCSGNESSLAECRREEGEGLRRCRPGRVAAVICHRMNKLYKDTFVFPQNLYIEMSYVEMPVKLLL